MDGERLSDLRKDKGLTQRQLGDVIGVSEGAISSYERNATTPDDEIKIKLAKYFDVSLDYLLGLTNKQNPLDQTTTSIILIENLPMSAKEDLKDYLNEFKRKHNLK